MHTLVIIPIEFRSAANEQAAQLQWIADETTAGDTFTRELHPVSAPDDTTPSHVCCASAFREDIRAMADGLLPTFPGASLHDYDLADAEFVPTLLASLGLRFSAATP